MSLYHTGFLEML